MEFQVLSHGFKVSKRVNIMKVYSFYLLAIYLVNNPVYLNISTLEKHQYRDNKWMVTSSCTKRTITRLKLLET